ncbi:MAG: class I SAM-dependent methyltransferase [Endozoicomonas sp.]|uniref:class I SAM-dependent methyltransferase n=1 Tax=Endozoicomonas sp. TaxID=1892382 RepID=UPI003D9BE32A
MSNPVPDFAPTEHASGFTFGSVNPLINDWIQCWNGVHPLLDIGCGNCLNAIKGIESGANVIATEVHEDSLEKIRKSFAQQERLSFMQLKLPAPFPFAEQSLSGILCSEVLHFLDHDELTQSVRSLHQALVPNGKVAVTALCEDFAPYQALGFKDLKIKQRETSPDRLMALQHPLDWFEKSAARFSDPNTQYLIELHRAHVPAFMNFFNPEQLAGLFEKEGFIIERIDSGAAPYYPIWEHGEHDQVRLVARKPL